MNIKSKIVPFAAILLLLGACSKKNDSTPTTARVSFTNACLNSTGLDATVNSAKVSNGTNIVFLKSSGYQDVTAGTVKAGFAFNTTAQLVKDTSVTLAVQNNYSVFVGGNITSPFILFTTDDLTAPASGMAKVRFVNLSTDALNEDVYVGSQKVSSAVTYKGITAFSSVTAGSNIKIIVTDPNNVPANIDITLALNSGKIYTVVLTGVLGGSSTAARTLTVINNN